MKVELVDLPFADGRGFGLALARRSRLSGRMTVPGKFGGVIARGAIFFCCALALAPEGRAQTASPAPPTVTVAFWNTQWFPGRRPNASRAEEERQMRAVQGEVARFNADIIGFEEMRDADHAIVALHPLTNFKVDACSTFPPREGQKVAQQVALTSRLSASSAWAESWKAGSAITPPRGFAFAAYEIAPKQLLLVYALHLKSNRGEIHEDIGIREESIRQLLEHIKAMDAAYGKLGTLSWVIGGDFNTAPDDPRFAGENTVRALLGIGFRWAWEGIPFANRVTLPPDKRFPAACFDQIFYRNARLIKAWVPQTSAQASDHRPVCATLALSAAP